MESHAKHADSIWWQSGGGLFLNLFIPSTVKALGFEIDLDTAYPFDEHVALTIGRAPAGQTALAIRLPGWCDAPQLSLNGEPFAYRKQRGYAVVERRWKAGEDITLKLPMRLRAEPAPGDDNLLAFTSGPLVLSADLGPADQPWEGLGPAFVKSGESAELLRSTDRAHHFDAVCATGETLHFSPFFKLYDRRSAMYFPTFTQEQWARNRQSYLAGAEERRRIAASTLDIVYLGEMPPERDHDFRTTNSEVAQWNGRSARKIPQGGKLSVVLRVQRGRNMLRVTYWGQDVGRHYRFSFGGTPFATERRPGEATSGFKTMDYSLPETIGTHDAMVRIEVEAEQGDGVIYELRTLRA
jgi:hypothetical protein